MSLGLLLPDPCWCLVDTTGSRQLLPRYPVRATPISPNASPLTSLISQPCASLDIPSISRGPLLWPASIYLIPCFQSARRGSCMSIIVFGEGGCLLHYVGESVDVKLLMNPILRHPTHPLPSINLPFHHIPPVSSSCFRTNRDE